MANLANTPKISLIAAISRERRALGFQNKLLWKIEGDLPRFKKLTTGRPIIMGRKTYESIGRPLPNRTNIVISRSNHIAPTEGIFWVNSIENALVKAKEVEEVRPDDIEREIFVIGGGQIYNEAIKYADRLYLTLVDDEPEADTFFPDYSEFTTEVHRQVVDFTPRLTYLTLERP